MQRHRRAFACGAGGVQGISRRMRKGGTARFDHGDLPHTGAAGLPLRTGQDESRRDYHMDEKEPPHLSLIHILAEGFYCIDKIKQASGTDYGTYSGYMMEGDHVLLLPAEDEGTFRVWYNAYPTRITAETAADFPIDLHEEAAHYVAHYMACLLYTSKQTAGTPAAAAGRV